MKQHLGTLLFSLLVVGVTYGIFLSISNQVKPIKYETISGLIAPDQMALLTDPKLVKYLDERHIQLNLTEQGSREITNRKSLDGFDFILTSGHMSSDLIRKKFNLYGTKSYYYSPIVIATWRNFAEVLKANGIITKSKGIFYIDEMQKLSKFVANRSKWEDLGYWKNDFTKKQVAITSPDPEKSDIGAMFLALLGYYENNEQLIRNQEEINKHVETLKNIFQQEVHSQYSTTDILDDYSKIGAGLVQMAVLHEAQFIEKYLTTNKSLREEMVLLYPKPAIFTKFVYVPLSKAGKILNSLFTDIDSIGNLVMEHGYRYNLSDGFYSHIEEYGLSVPERITDALDTPNLDIIKKLIEAIKGRKIRHTQTVFRSKTSSSTTKPMTGYIPRASRKQTSSKVIELVERSVSSDAEVHIVSIYKGKEIPGTDYSPWWSKCDRVISGSSNVDKSTSCHQKYAGIDHGERQMSIQVNSTKHPVVLLLNSYEPTVWTIKKSPAASLEKVILCGYHAQRSVNMNFDIPIGVSNSKSLSVCKNCYLASTRCYVPYDINKLNTRHLNSIKAVTGVAKPPRSFQGLHSGEKFYINDYLPKLKLLK